jgi:hypothetical protein
VAAAQAYPENSTAMIPGSMADVKALWADNINTTFSLIDSTVQAFHTGIIAAPQPAQKYNMDIM